MAVKISSLRDEEIRKIGDAFADHEYAEAEWDAKGYIMFINENGFEVKRAKQLASTIPLVYTECKIADGR